VYGVGVLPLWMTKEHNASTQMRTAFRARVKCEPHLTLHKLSSTTGVQRYYNRNTTTVFFILEGTVFCNVLVELPGNIDFYTFFSRRNGQILGAPLVLKKEGYSMKDTSIFLTHTARTLRFTFHKVYLIE